MGGAQWKYHVIVLDRVTIFRQLKLQTGKAPLEQIPLFQPSLFSHIKLSLYYFEPVPPQKISSTDIFLVLGG